MKKIITILSLALTALVSCTSETDKSTADTSAEASSEKVEIDSAKIWTYSEEVDKMTSEKKYYASIGSTNSLDFDFPYDGGSTGGILITHHADGDDNILLSISKGQFTCDISDGCIVKVRFDSDPAIDFSASGPSDGSSEYLFLEPSKKFISNARKAKKMLVQAEFYEEGLREMEFDIAGLKWDFK